MEVINGLLVVLLVVLGWVAFVHAKPYKACIWFGGAAVLAVLVILGVRWLIRWQQRREAAYGEQRAAIASTCTSYEIPERRVVGPAHVHYHFHGAIPDEVRRALKGRRGQSAL